MYLRIGNTATRSPIPHQDPFANLTSTTIADYTHAERNGSSGSFCLLRLQPRVFVGHFTSNSTSTSPSSESCLLCFTPLIILGSLALCTIAVILCSFIYYGGKSLWARRRKRNDSAQEDLGDGGRGEVNRRGSTRSLSGWRRLSSMFIKKDIRDEGIDIGNLSTIERGNSKGSWGSGLWRSLSVGSKPTIITGVPDVSFPPASSHNGGGSLTPGSCPPYENGAPSSNCEGPWRPVTPPPTYDPRNEDWVNEDEFVGTIRREETETARTPEFRSSW